MEMAQLPMKNIQFWSPQRQLEMSRDVPWKNFFFLAMNTDGDGLTTWFIGLFATPLFGPHVRIDSEWLLLFGVELEVIPINPFWETR